MKLRITYILVSTTLLSACINQEVVRHKYDATPAITETKYKESSDKLGTVLLAVNWNRYWRCAGYENAELRSIGFDLMPKKHSTNNHAPDFILNGSAGGPDFIVYSSMLVPGTYALSRVKIKVAHSMSDVSYLTLERTDLFDNGTSLGGEFSVTAGQVVYIGHFGLDCGTTTPLLWRYYKENKASFQEFTNKTKSYIPYLDSSDIQFRLFQTKQFGYDFTLQ